VIICEGVVTMLVHNNPEQVAAGLPKQEEVSLKFGDYIDEHIMLLPAAGYLRRNTLYAQTDCVVALLTSSDLSQLQKDRPQIYTHVRPFITQAKRSRFMNKIDIVFMEIDKDGDGWITRDEFANKLMARRRRENGGTDAEVFFHTILASQPVTDELINEIFRDIVLTSPPGGNTSPTKPVPLHLLEQPAPADTNSFDSQIGALDQVVDRDRFSCWWLSDDTHEQDENAERRK
jgi:hypothetical protein